MRFRCKLLQIVSKKSIFSGPSTIPALKQLFPRDHFLVVLLFFFPGHYDSDSRSIKLWSIDAKLNQHANYEDLRLGQTTHLPALPIICMTSRSPYSLIASPCQLTVFLMITIWQGRLTPTASVDVQQMTLMFPSKYPFSTMFLSFRSRPAWWKATPDDTHSRSY
jgi:hypothetical protein